MEDATSNNEDTRRQMLRHTVATLGYRGLKALSNTPAGFADFRSGETTRTPGEILAHLTDLFNWALRLANGEHVFKESAVLPWEEGVTQFFSALEAFDKYLASNQPLGFPPEKLFQGPIADALTHVGQISFLRRLAGAPVRGENYVKADIAAGPVGREQAAARLEFD
jgi:hypothetical protein